MPILSGSRRFQQLRTISGLVLFAYVLMHMLNHSLGLVSLEAMDRWRFLLSWQFAGGWIVILAAAVVHSVHALWSLYDRRVMRMPAWQFMQLLLGLAIPFLLIEHVLGTRAVAELYGVQPSYALVQLTYWRLAPHLGILQSTVMIISWVHGCVGLHFWLRLRPWYRSVAPGLFTLAVLVPTLALLGFVVSGRALLVETADGAAVAEILKAAQVPGPTSTAFVGKTALFFRYGFAGLIAATLFARGVRNLLSSRFGTMTLSYADGPTVTLLPGASILEMSRAYGVPHASVCGGRGRCSTCRVSVGLGRDRLPAPSSVEQRVLTRIGAAADVRLACMVRPKHSLTVRPLMPPASTPELALRPSTHLEGQEREIVILFADLRGFTSLSEARLPYDVVFVLNRYFEAVGQAVESNNGHIDKFIGDGMMALFGISDDPVRAANDALVTARAIAERIDRLNRDLEHDLPNPLRVAIGIHAGTVILGEMGYGRARSFTAIGDPVNTTSRLEQIAKDNEVELVVSREVEARAGIDLGRHPLQFVPVRGRKAALEVRLIRSAGALGALPVV
ncbi:2Fe-2S iron-sulfur cluster binding domain-containing protein [Skermanella sp. TT6]|uniref:2Fe-2S iron-sulfur cluster binding domain-containing protein n=1 Tax=Skermanella cutis TaxID=2775420 RepID=A0ABX7BCA2_9PROT|nr:adenylate/guanylate cyclase domain-containing protein [Skermanella sp. TT6]QQP92023.1 2Fe-2S iron-sulfur cluster binding domain-containing protein [Skermanella sp. TT6]